MSYRLSEGTSLIIVSVLGTPYSLLGTLYVCMSYPSGPWGGVAVSVDGNLSSEREKGKKRPKQIKVSGESRLGNRWWEGWRDRLWSTYIHISTTEL